MAWEPDRRYNFFFSPPAHLCAVTYMTEISLIVTLNNQFTHSLTLSKVGEYIIRIPSVSQKVTWLNGAVSPNSREKVGPVSVLGRAR